MRLEIEIERERMGDRVVDHGTGRKIARSISVVWRSGEETHVVALGADDVPVRVKGGQHEEGGRRGKADLRQFRRIRAINSMTRLATTVDFQSGEEAGSKPWMTMRRLGRDYSLDDLGELTLAVSTTRARD